jgi:hypothetical protein
MGFYLAYKNKRWWQLLDTMATYMNFLVCLSTLLINIFGWYNLVNVLVVSCFLLFIISLGLEFGSIKKSRSLDPSKTLDERQISGAKVQFDSLLKRQMLRKRHFAWQAQFLLVSLSIVSLYILPQRLTEFFCPMQIDEGG